MMASIVESRVASSVAATACTALSRRAFTTTAGGSLASEIVGKVDDAEEEWVFLHGVLGSRRNWRTWARRFAQDAAPTNIRCCLVDLRNHGDSSTSFHPPAGPNTIEAAAEDIATMITSRSRQEGQPRIGGLLGHSLGGKIALRALERLPPDAMPRQAWIIDSNPGRTPSHAGRVDDTRTVFDTLAGVDPSRFSKQSEVFDHLLDVGLSAAIAQWLCSSLEDRGSAGGLAWKFRVEACREMYESFKQTDAMGVLERPPQGTTIHVVRGGRSSRLDADEPAILRLDADPGVAVRYHTIAHADHWVHVDAPQELKALVIDHAFARGA